MRIACVMGISYINGKFITDTERVLCEDAGMNSKVGELRSN